ncbi:hypothetical protein MKZ38_010080 [Zalerion maritima]|uniref:RNA polymerase II degradation factor 1 n=1 Tax=Zalerion maritima TaxID=339359 RepID=A0AAD5RU23_9PEZI|nr:hypothetical protein MKZ38_010080 [Zalerion maritima]
MAEIQSRPSSSTRGRGSGRGGRGALSSRGGRASTRSPNANGDSSFEDEGEIGFVKKKYAGEIAQIKEVFPGWSDVDIAFALQETNGDVELACTRIADGSISQWGEVQSHKKHHGRSKAKESTTAPEPTTKPARGGRAESGRGGRGKSTERGGRGGSRTRGASHVATNGSHHKENQALSIPTEKAWGDATPISSDGWGNDDTLKQASSTATKAASAALAASPAAPKPANPPTKKTWASMLRQSTEPPKPVEAAAPKSADSVEHLPPAPAPETEASEPQPIDTTSIPEESEPEKTEPEEQEESQPTTTVSTSVEPEVALPPSKDQLTEMNLEQVADTSHPPATITAASTAADSWDPRLTAASSSATPVSASQQQHQTPKAIAVGPVGSGYAASAQKATERVSRGPTHHQRRILDQEEAVRMPGHREVDRATVQFGAFSLVDAEEDVDEDREDAETRAQPPADSPVAHPRASLPPAQLAPTSDTFSASKPTAPSAAVAAPSIPTGPAASSTLIASATPAAPTAPAGAPTQPAAAAGMFRTNLDALAAAYPQAQVLTSKTAQQPPQGPQQYGRFPQPGSQDQPGFPQKSYDTFAGQTSTPNIPQSQSQYEAGIPAQASQAQQGPIQQPTGGAFSSAPNDYSYYASADQGNRGAPYNNNFYNQQYGGAQQQQQQQPAAQTAGQQGAPQDGAIASQQRGFGAYNNSQNDNQYPQSSVQASRFGASAAADAQNSGHNTPNPTQSHPPPGNPGHGMQPQGQGQYSGYNHPYYQSPYYSSYMYGNTYGAGNYGGGPYGKGSVYGQPHQYGMSPQAAAPFDHSSSGNTGFGQSSLHRGDSGLSSGLGGDYQRGASTQMGGQPGIGGAGGFGGGMHDSFGRGAGSGYSSQAGQSGYNAQGSQAGNAGSGADDLKPQYGGDSKTTGGPSPSLGAAARPGSAANPAASQSTLPPPQSNPQGMGGYGGYQSHLQGQHGLHGSQSGSGGAGYGMGGGAGQGHGNTYPYGNQYGGGSFYGNQQQRGGWGGNYH